MKRAVLAIAAAFALATGPLAGVALAQPEGQGPGASSQPPPQELPDLEVQQPKKGKGPSQAELDAQAMAKAPQLVAAAQIKCTPTAARNAGSYNQTNAQNKKVNFDAIEVACQDDLGYMLMAFEKSPVVQGRDCVSQYTGARGPTDPLLCKLPANTPPQKLLQPRLTKAGSPCQATNVRAIGETPTARYYEFTCASGVGVVLSDPKTPEGKTEIPSCLQTPAAGLTCKLTTEDQNLDAFKPLATKADEKCTADKRRYVMTVNEGDVVEVACANGSGMLVIAKAGQFVNSVPCAKSAPYKGGCTFTDIKAAQTADVGTYTVAARKAGYDCDVSKYGIFAGAGRGEEIVELACKNRPDGAIVMFKEGNDRVFNCSRSELAGYRCNYTPVEASYPQLNSELAASGKGACKVNASRAIGANKDNAFLEVACADGDPGWVIEYPLNSAKPNDIMSCGIARARGIGACDLPTNKRAAGAG